LSCDNPETVLVQLSVNVFPYQTKNLGMYLEPTLIVPVLLSTEQGRNCEAGVEDAVAIMTMPACKRLPSLNLI
jgi:hypothetical protein